MGLLSTVARIAIQTGKSISSPETTLTFLANGSTLGTLEKTRFVVVNDPQLINYLSPEHANHECRKVLISETDTIDPDLIRSALQIGYKGKTYQIFKETEDPSDARFWIIRMHREI